MKKLNLLFLLLVPLFLMGLEEKEAGMKMYYTDHGNILAGVQRAIQKDRPTFTTMYNVMREWTNYEYVFVFLAIVNNSLENVYWDDFSDYNKITIELKDGTKIKSVNYASKLKEGMIEAWDIYFGDFDNYVRIEGTIKVVPHWTKIKYIGFDKGFSWLDVEKIYIHWRGTLRPMTITTL